MAYVLRPANEEGDQATYFDLFYGTVSEVPQTERYHSPEDGQ